MPPMPNLKGDGPVDYRRARIYTSVSRMAWRTIMEHPNYSTVVCNLWSDKPRDAWKQVLQTIDEHYDEAKR